MRPNTTLVTEGLAQKHLYQEPDRNWYEENLIQKVTDRQSCQPADEGEKYILGPAVLLQRTELPHDPALHYEIWEALHITVQILSL